MLEQACNEHHGPIDDRLEQDRLDQRSAIVVAQKGHRIGDQHCLANAERRRGGEHGIAEGDQVIGEDQVNRIPSLANRSRLGVLPAMIP